MWRAGDRQDEGVHGTEYEKGGKVKGRYGDRNKRTKVRVRRKEERHMRQK